MSEETMVGDQTVANQATSDETNAIDERLAPVSYTHLDVYKRQCFH